MIAWNVIHRDTVASTMDEIDALAESGAPGGTVVVAAVQTGGRGRAGRAWTAPAGSGLFCSVLYRPDLTVSQTSSLPLVVGVAVAKAIENVTRRTCELKWPNDVLIDCGKIAGILVTTRLERDQVRFANIGIGLNCTSSLSELPPGAASLFTATGSVIPPHILLPEVLSFLSEALDDFLTAGGRPSLDEWWRLAAFRGEPVRLINDGVDVTGTLVGVDWDGALVILSEAGVRTRIVAGDLTRGPTRSIPL